MADEDRPTKRVKTFDERDSEDEVEQGEPKYSNLYEKYGVRRVARPSAAEELGVNDDDDDDDDSSDDGSEDDAADLATANVDAEIAATLAAIRSKDPRIYDKNHKFYTEDEYADAEGDKAREKPMYLKEYQTKNLLAGGSNMENEDDAPPRTYAQEQEALRKGVIDELKQAADGDEDMDDSDEDEFLVSKSKIEKPSTGKTTAETSNGPSAIDVRLAEQDPETYLSNYLVSRAWVPAIQDRFQPMESDDEDEERAREEFEHSYNLRFEPEDQIKKSIASISRKTAAQMSVRRDDEGTRKKKRKAGQAKRESEEAERLVQKNELRKQKMEDVEGRVRELKKVIPNFDIEEWTDLLEGDWDDTKWDAELQKRLGESPEMNGNELQAGEDDVPAKNRPKKPTWDDDINVDVDMNMDDDEEEGGVDIIEPDGGDGRVSTKGKAKKDRKQAQIERKQKARKERQTMEGLVDETVDGEVMPPQPGSRKAGAGKFRYRETSPTNYGLTARDILFAEDSALNQYASMKKLASFRDANQKAKDARRLSKKARLKQWRKDTFGDHKGPIAGPAPNSTVSKSAAPDERGVLEAENDAAEAEAELSKAARKNRKRSKRRKAAAEAAAPANDGAVE